MHFTSIAILGLVASAMALPAHQEEHSSNELATPTAVDREVTASSSLTIDVKPSFTQIETSANNLARATGSGSEESDGSSGHPTASSSDVYGPLSLTKRENEPSQVTTSPSPTPSLDTVEFRGGRGGKGKGGKGKGGHKDDYTTTYTSLPTDIPVCNVNECGERFTGPIGE